MTAKIKEPLIPWQQRSKSHWFHEQQRWVTLPLPFLFPLFPSPHCSSFLPVSTMALFPDHRWDGWAGQGSPVKLTVRSTPTIVSMRNCSETWQMNWSLVDTLMLATSSSILMIVGQKWHEIQKATCWWRTPPDFPLAFQPYRNTSIGKDWSLVSSQNIVNVLRTSWILSECISIVKFLNL